MVRHHRLHARRIILCVALLPIAPWACTRTAERTPERAPDSAQASASIAPAPADTDDFGLALPIDVQFAERVVSLNPAATEIIFAIGAEARLVGRSRWDIYPPAASAIPAVGDGIRPNVEAVLQMRPTLVVLYATAENRAAATAFAKAGVRTIALRVDRIAQFVTLTRQLGIALGESARAATVIDSVKHTLDKVREVTRRATPRSVVWPLWQQPIMVVGSGSYLDELIEIAGGRNVFHDIASPSPQVSLEEVARRNPDAIIGTEKVRDQLLDKPHWKSVAAARDGRFILEDPALTGRPSVMLGMAAVALAHALHPELADQLPAAPRRIP